MYLVWKIVGISVIEPSFIKKYSQEKFLLSIEQIVANSPSEPCLNCPVQYYMNSNYPLGCCASTCFQLIKQPSYYLCVDAVYRSYLTIIGI